MQKEFTLQQYIDVKGAAEIAAEIGVEVQTVHYWKNFRSAPKPHTAAKLIQITNGILTWGSIYAPFVHHNCEKQLEFDFNGVST